MHNLFGLMEEKATNLALRDVIPGKRPFLISRSTFPSSGRWTGHWVSIQMSINHSETCILNKNCGSVITLASGSTWPLTSREFYSSSSSRSQWSARILVDSVCLLSPETQGTEVTNSFGVDGNTDEELCNRWMQLSAFAPFYRNHNTLGAISQEPYRWDSVANASRTAFAIRYALLPYWVSSLILDNQG